MLLKRKWYSAGKPADLVSSGKPYESLKFEQIMLERERRDSKIVETGVEEVS
jgi:hypothetical protein